MYGKLIEMTPIKLRDILNNKPIAYCAISPVQWHGNHLPLGTDALRAEWILSEACQRTGGVILPTEYCGTDVIISKGNNKYWHLESLAEEKLLGNFLYDEVSFHQRVSQLVKNVIRNGFKVLIIGTGSMSQHQLTVLSAIEMEFSNEEFKVIIWHSKKVSYPDDLKVDNLSHAGLSESSEMMVINDELVELDNIEETKNMQLGKKRLECEVDQLVDIVKSAI